MPTRMVKENIKITATYPIELHYIKALFLQKRYRQCIDACRHVLLTTCNETADHALQVAFANFYLGLAHDELARLMHDFSQAKVPALDQAERFFRDALRSLPSADGLASTLRARQASVHKQSSAIDDPFSVSPGAAAPTSERATRHESDDYDPYNCYSPTTAYHDAASCLRARPIAHVINRRDALATTADRSTTYNFDICFPLGRVSVTTTPNRHTAHDAYLTWLGVSSSTGFTAKSIPRSAKAARCWKSLTEP
ncbi:hypothetical protein KC357_g416 [Hortaea werneckii]|nr:hypothetical protein KC354_g11284 [Hortaea werneckii]KAI7496501.1 hypothetical protein KC357_g416 [Hortaea werneckii]